MCGAENMADLFCMGCWGFFLGGGGGSLTVRVEWCYLIAISQLSSFVFHFLWR